MNLTKYINKITTMILNMIWNNTKNIAIFVKGLKDNYQQRMK